VTREVSREIELGEAIARALGWQEAPSPGQSAQTATEPQYFYAENAVAEGARYHPSDAGRIASDGPQNANKGHGARNARAERSCLRCRAKCLDCCCGSAHEVRRRISIDCALWPFRMGANPWRKPISEEERQRRAERLRNTRALLRTPDNHRGSIASEGVPATTLPETV
jgi:hypothetical protein